jgi:uncharacterized protein (TIGR02646 family)
MIHLDRLPQPDILQQNRDTWLARFLERREQGDNPRPPSSQYGHQQIRDCLGAMSYQKCFYCETKIAEREAQIDHYIEVAESPELAFEWENLYLSCKGCNQKKRSNRFIPVVECIDPCGDEDPGEHIAFENEIITAKNGSQIALRTISKYGLDRDELNYLRVKALQQFEKTLRELRERKGDLALTDDEKEVLRRYQQMDHPFSLMFRVYLSDVQL